MYPSEIIRLLEMLGWLTAAALISVWTSLPRSAGRRYGGLLVVFCLARLLATAAEEALRFPEWRVFAAAIGGWPLAEFARRVWNERGGRRIPAFVHLVPLECGVLVAAAWLASGTDTPAWLLPVDILWAMVPGIFGGVACGLLWRGWAADARLRVALAGLALYGLGASPHIRAWILLAPGLTTLGFGLICFANPLVRTRPALIWCAGLVLTAVIGPLLVTAGAGRLYIYLQERVLEDTERAAQPLQGPLAARLAAPSLDTATRERVREYLGQLLAGDARLREVSLWQLRGNHRWRFERVTGDWVDEGIAPASFMSATTQGDVRALPPESQYNLVTGARAPVRPGKFENPTAWLALELNAPYWASIGDYAGGMGLALVCALAVLCAVGFVLATRHALERVQQLQMERLQAADRAKAEFLAFLGHELRTPLQTMLGRASLLHGTPEAARHAAVIETQGQLLLRLVNDLLDLGTIEAGKFRLRVEAFSLRGVLDAVDDAVRPAALAKALALEIAVASEVPDALTGDEARLRQILGNLLGNAVKFTARGEIRLEVGVESAAGAETGGAGEANGAGEAEPKEAGPVALVFRASDTGPGLPPEKIPQLFTLFTRLDAGDTFTREGTGVGLALVRRLCTAMGGTVMAANRAGGGAEFVVRLTLPRAERAEAKQERGASGVAAGVEGSAGATDAVVKKRILVAEDNTAARELFAEALAAHGCEVVATGDGAAALAAAEAATGENFFAGAIIDVNLPGIDGVALARQLRARHPSMRLVACSAEALPAVREAALAAGCDEFLVKPVALDALARAVGAAPGGTVFEQLASAAATERTRGLLVAEWPRLRAATETAIATGESEAARRLAHYLQTSARLIADETLLSLCRELATARDAEIARYLDGIEDHLGRAPLAASAMAGIKPAPQ